MLINYKVRAGRAGMMGGAIAIALAGVGAAQAPGQSVDMEALKRALRGEAAAERGADEFTQDFMLQEDEEFENRTGNLFFPLNPGHTLYLAGEDDEEFVEVIITVLRDTFRVTIEIDGEPERIRTRVVEEREFIDGELFEVSRNYFATRESTGDVMYFGEDVCFFEDGECVGTDGSWLAGEDGAAPGVIMPGTFLLGSRYFQEVAPGIALDRAEHTAMGETFVTPAGTFEDCIIVEETSALEGGESEKVYAPGIGLIKDDELELVSYELGRRR